jgi:Uma2 family endonuclease
MDMYTSGMTRGAPVLTGVSFDEFLAFETRSQVRHEFVDGNLFEMPGGTVRHNRITGRLFAKALPVAEALGFEALMTDVLVRTPSGIGYYPDFFVVDPAEDANGRVKQFPRLIVEVLSPSTEIFDRTEKWRNYQQISTLETYILLSQSEPRAEVYARQKDGAWLYTEATTGNLRLACLSLDVPLEALYDGLPQADLE